MKSVTVETFEIPTKSEVDIEIKVLCLKLIFFTDSFTLGELATLQKYMENEGYL